MWPRSYAADGDDALDGVDRSTPRLERDRHPAYPSPMPRAFIPDEILSLAHDRAAARADRNWDEADRLRTEIEAAGWKVVDRGTDFALEPASAPTVAEDGIVRYGSTDAVPSRLAEPDATPAAVILVATDWPDDLRRTLDGLRDHAPLDTSVVIVADGPSPDQDETLPRPDERVEVVRTSERLGAAAAWNVGIRRATGRVVVLVDTSVEPLGDIVSPLVAALDGPTVGVAGGYGIVSRDLRKFEDAPAGDVTAVEGYALAFRRSDAAARGPLDERFRFYRNLDIWWSLVLRDEGEDRPARRAVAVPIPAERHEHRGWSALPAEDRDRLSKRNFYRIIDRFGARRDLASS
jgi:hypothetical protein